MGVDFAYVRAWVLPVFAGSGVWLALHARRRVGGDIAAALGAGWLIGVFVASTIARFVAADDTAHAFAAAWPWLIGIGVIAWVAAYFRLRGSETWLARTSPIVVARPTRAMWMGAALLLIAIVVRLIVIGDEASLRPVFPWDAWSAWAIKPKTWFLLGHADPYVPMIEWLSNPVAATRTAAAGSYPELLAWLQLWFASATGAWNEPLVNVAWCGALSAFALAAYGYWRSFGLSMPLALALVYALVSLPLIDAHIALAGYADIWIAVTLGLAVSMWTRWLILRERGQWLLAIAVAVCLPAIKNEGAVWLLAFAAVVVLDLVPMRWRWRLIAAAAVLLVIGLLVGGFDLPIPGLGVVHVGRGKAEIPGVAVFELAWHGVGGAVIASLFTLPNWHLLWYAFPLLLIVRRRRFRDDPVARLVGLLLLIDFAFLFVLFFFTPASAWARDYTSANRLMLQVVPSVFVLAAVLLRPLAVSAEERSRARGWRSPSVPA